VVIRPVAVEKLASEKSAKIKTRQEPLQTIFFDHLDIFYPRISTCFRKKGVFQQPRLLTTVILKLGAAISSELVVNSLILSARYWQLGVSTMIFGVLPR
jgi:hypothetical protein